MPTVTVKGWSEFQHYKDRSPPWIKLHKTLLDDYEFQTLQLASKALAPMFWLLASESSDGSFDADPEKLAFRLRTDKKVVTSAVKELIDKGFLIDASGVLADCKRDARPETETEGETETTLSGKPDVAPRAQTLETAKRVLEFLNAKTGKAYKPVAANLDLITARLKEGFDETTCRQVIAKKHREWSTDEKMAQYLRPETLFGRTKFAQYSGELVEVRND